MGPLAPSASLQDEEAAAKKRAEDAATLERAKAGHTTAQAAMYQNFLDMADDLQMRKGGEHQWDATSLRDRKRFKRPIVTSDRLRGAVKQVTGEVYKSRPSIRCAPADGAASPETAEMYEGVIRYIEHRSGTQTIYPMLVQSSADCGLGHARLRLVYSDDGKFETPEQIEQGFDTEVRIALIPNQFSVLWDPASKDPQRADANWCLVVSEVDEKTFKEAYPEAGQGGWQRTQQYGLTTPNWGVTGKVTIAEYWEIKREPVRLVKLIHNQRVQGPPITDAIGFPQPGEWFEPSGATTILKDPDGQILAEAQAGGFSIVQERIAYKRSICMHLLGGNDVLAGPIYWPGQRIPIFTCEGEVLHAGEERIVHGLVRHAKPDQRRLNIALSSGLELTEMAPKNPFLVEDGMIADYEDEWVLAAQQPAMYLRYKAGKNGAKPERMPPVGQNTGPDAMAGSAIDGIKATTGFSDASLGQRSNETSGVAIDARDEQSDTGAYVYGANLSATLQAMGQEIVNVVPFVYSGRALITILGEDDTPAIIDMEEMRAQGRSFDVGKYQVICNQGISYQTQRDKENELLAKMADAMAGQPTSVVPMIYLARNMNMKNVDDFVGDLVAVLGQGGIVLPSMQQAGAAPGMPPGMPGMPQPGAPGAAPPPPGAPPGSNVIPMQRPPGPQGVDPLAELSIPPPSAPAARTRAGP